MTDVYLANKTDFESVANAIRSKAGTTGQLSFPTGMVSSIASISSGVECATTTFTPQEDSLSYVVTNTLGKIPDLVIVELTSGTKVNGTEIGCFFFRNDAVSGIGRKWTDDNSVVHYFIGARNYYSTNEFFTGFSADIAKDIAENMTASNIKISAASSYRYKTDYTYKVTFYSGIFQ